MDITKPSVDGVEYRLDVFGAIDSDAIIDSDISRSYQISRTWLAMQSFGETDLFAYLIQFREELPDTITSNLLSPFKYPNWDRDTKLYKVGKIIETYFKYYTEEELDAVFIRNSVTIEFFEILTLLDFYIKGEIIQHSGEGIYKAAKEYHLKLVQLLNSLTPHEYSDDSGITVIPKPAEATATVKDPKVTISTRKCEIPIYTRETCGRDVFKNNNCIFHCGNVEQQHNQIFAKVFAELFFTKDDVVDCTGFIFPDWFSFPQRRMVTNDVIFKDCVFYGFVNFRDYIFCGQILIANSSLEKGASFVSARFQQSCEILSCHLSLLDMTFTVFQDGFVFINNSSDTGQIEMPEGGQQLRIVDLRGVAFQDGQKVFIKGIKPGGIALGGSNLANAGHLSFGGLNRDDNSTFMLADEHPFFLGRELGNEPRQVRLRNIEDSYQQIQRHLNSIRNYSDAGGFHEREMILRHDFLTQSFWGRQLNGIYGTLAVYGESLRRPFGWLCLLLFVIPLLTMFLLGDNTANWTGEFSDLGSGITLYFEDFVRNLESLYSIKSNPFMDKFGFGNGRIGWIWGLALIVEKIFTFILVSFIVINVRRKFRRY